MSIETIFRIIAILLFLSGTSVSLYYRRKADRTSGEAISLRKEGWPVLIALRLSGLGLWVSVIAYMLNPGWMSWASLPLPVWVRWGAVGLAAVAWALTVWMFRSLGNNITPTVVTRREHKLVTAGPYRWIRHPLYTFATSFYVSLGLIAANWLIPLLAGLIFILLAVRTPNEEQKLVEKFGDEYRRYMERTGRFLPRLGARRSSALSS
jgi:protein-S-isoprenylcysteine O-methyltransferase Ste14